MLMANLKIREYEIIDLEPPYNPFKLLKYKYFCAFCEIGSFINYLSSEDRTGSNKIHFKDETYFVDDLREGYSLFHLS